MSPKAMIGFLGIGQSSYIHFLVLEEPVVKLAVPHYLFTPLPFQKRGYIGMKSESLSSS